MRCWLRLMLTALLASSAFAAAPKRPITHEDVWLMRRLGAPIVSPDGKWAVLPVTEPSYDPRAQVSDIWLVSLSANRPPRKITSTAEAESGVAWSADSRKIAFSTRRAGDEVPQIYALDLSGGGEAERLTQLSTGARQPRWSPDGKRILYVSDVYPGLGDEANRARLRSQRERKYHARVFEGFPIRHWDRWLDERRPHLFVQEARAGAPAKDILEGTELVKQPGYGGRLTQSEEELPAVWTPDGSSVLFVASLNRNGTAYSELYTYLFLVSAEGGEPKRLTEGTATYGTPVFAPDGHSFVVAVTPAATNYVYNLARLTRFVWPFDAEKTVVLTLDFDRDPDVPVISGDSTTVYFTAEEAGLEKIYSVSIDGGPVTTEYSPPAGVVTRLAGGGLGQAFQLVALWDSSTTPQELYAFTPGDPKPHPLTRFNVDRAADLDLFPAEHFWIQTNRGQRIHSMLVRPAGFDPTKKYPVLAVMHGGPNMMIRDSFGVRWNYHLLAGNRYLVVLTNYTGSTGFGEAFSQAIQGDPLRGPAEDVNDAVDEVVRRFAFADGEHQAALGASYGGHLANWLEATTRRYRCLVAHAALVNLESQWATSDEVYGREIANGGPIWQQGAPWREQNPVRLVGNQAAGTGWLTPMLVTAGENDFRVPLNNALETWTYLQRLQVPSRLVLFPDENHWISKGEDSRYWYGELQDWLTRWMK
ncbi:prolyl oligopeptidase [Opitutaceae bacterium EW11]|nr:prolyl oligopeptidase [Opitutaceae bacterium EW11]